MGAAPSWGATSSRPAPVTTEDRWILASLLAALAGTGAGAVLRRPDAFGITALAVLALLVLAWRVTGSRRLGWLLVFGLVVGGLELVADWIHVARLGSLTYTDHFGFRVLASPSYMPAGWWLTSVQFGYIALRLEERWNRRIALCAVAVLGMCLPPWYEEFAAAAKAWHYAPGGPRLSETPLWVIVAYGGSILGIGAAASARYRPESRRRAVEAGVLAAGGILVAGVVAYLVLG